MIWTKKNDFGIFDDICGTKDKEYVVRNMTSFSNDGTKEKLTRSVILTSCFCLGKRKMRMEILDNDLDKGK